MTATAPPHPLLRLFLDAAAGVFPQPDGGVTVLPAPGNGLEASVPFTAHAVVATALAPEQVLALGPDGLGGSLAVDFLRALAGPAGWVNSVDVTLCALGAGGGPALPALPEAADHPRVRYARTQRTDVRVHGDRRGLVTLASGLAGRRELSIELTAAEHGRGAGRALLADALTLVPAGEPVFAAVAPGNARSLRAFLSAGFVPIGSEVLIRPTR